MKNTYTILLLSCVALVLSVLAVRQPASPLYASVGRWMGTKPDTLVKPTTYYSNGDPNIMKDALADGYVSNAWTPLTVTQRNVVKCWNRDYDFGANGLIESVSVAANNILEGAIRLETSTRAGIWNTVSLGETSITQQNNGRVKLSKKGKLFGQDLSINYTIEYDGLVWVECKGNITFPDSLVSVRLLIPMKNTHGELIHYVGAPRGIESQNLLKNSNATAFDPSHKGILWESGLKSSIWLGNNEAGLLWCMESDEHYFPKDNPKLCQVVRSNSTTELVLNIIDKEPKLRNRQLDWNVAFGLMATPTRPMPQGWRGLTLTAQYDAFKGGLRGSALVYWPDEWRTLFVDPDPTRIQNLQNNKQKVAKDRAENRKIMPYWSKLTCLLADENNKNPDADRMYKEWRSEPTYKEGLGKKRSQFRTSCKSGWADYMVWCVNGWGQKIGYLDGIYLDEIQPIPNTLASTGGGYDDIFSQKRYPTYDIWGMRNMSKRINKVAQQYTSAPMSIAHSSATIIPHSTSEYAILLTGEEYYSGYYKKENEALIPKGNERYYYYSHIMPMERLRAQSYYKQWGQVMAFLPCLKDQKDIMTSPIATRDLLSRVMHFDMIVWPLWCNADEVRKTWKFRQSFGIEAEEVDFVPYWENKFLTINNYNIVVSYYQKGKELLVIVSNLSNKKINTDINIFPKVRKAMDAETEKAMSIKNNKINIELLRNNYAALRLTLE